MTQRDFTKLCKEHGFAQTSPNTYARCVGDGILQTIDTSLKDYMSPYAPTYSQTNRKSKCIHVGILSLYAKWDEYCFEPNGYAAQFYTPSSFLGQRHSTHTFFGFDEHCRIMQETGLPYLDRITTQASLLDAKMELDKPICNRKWVHSLWLAAPLMACDRWEEAMCEVCRHYTHSWEAFHSKYDFLKASKQWDTYFQEEDRMNRELATTQLLWRALIADDREKIQAFLQENLTRNYAYAQKHSIPFVE